LIKLALSGFDCKASADIFQAQYDISKWIGTGFGRKQSNDSTQKNHRSIMFFKENPGSNRANQNNKNFNGMKTI
jgi:hypothetical protein